jgi:hypothetical protein
MRRFLAAIAIALTPASATVLAAPGAVEPISPIGVEAWRADPRHLPDPVTSGPAAIQRFFAGGGRDDLATAYPSVVGNLDGAPCSLKYTANKLAMATAGPEFSGKDGQFLLFDPRGQGHVAEVFGDLSTAQRIAVLVPGAGNRADNFWHGVGGKSFRSPARQGHALYLRAAQFGPIERFAVVVWLGYDPPSSINVTAAREDRARAGAAALLRFVAGLSVVRPQATLALLGYSYGSTVIGLAAAQLSSRVTDIAVFGSPGMGVDNVRELGATARVWAGLSDRDTMRFVPGVRFFGLGHGRQPADPAFGATVFPTDDVVDHDHYLAEGTDSQAAIAEIARLGTDRR